MRILCLESGGTKLVGALADSSGVILQKKIHYRKSNQTAVETLENLVELGKELLDGNTPAAIGFGFGGTVERSTGEPLTCFHEDGWEEVRAGEWLRNEFRVPVFIENDCNLAALAETRIGYGIQDGTVFYLTIGTGIGGGIVKDGFLLSSGEFGEGEIGHIVVDSEGPVCPCGRRGCLETLCSGPGLMELSKRLLGQPVDPRELMENLRNQQKQAMIVASAAAEYLSQVLASVINILSPGYIVFGGGVMRKNQVFLDLVRENTLKKIFPVFLRKPPVFKLSRLEESVVCQGAALFAIQKLYELEEKDSF